MSTDLKYPRCTFCPNRHDPKEQCGETGPEMLRRVVRVLDWTHGDAVDPFTAEECLNIVRACWGSKWDILPDNLTREELKYAARHGSLSVRCNARLDKELA